MYVFLFLRLLSPFNSNHTRKTIHSHLKTPTAEKSEMARTRWSFAFRAAGASALLPHGVDAMIYIKKNLLKKKT